MPDGDTEADWREQGESLLTRSQCAEALDLYTHILADHPDEPAAWVGKARALAAAIPGCHATFYSDESHSLNSHMREILTAMISGAESEQSEHETADSPQV